MGQTPKKRKPLASRDKEPETPEKRRHREAANAVTVALRKNKQLIDKVRKDVTEHKNLVPNVESRGFPKETVSFLLGSLNELQSYSNECADAYAEAIIKPEEPAAAGATDALVEAAKAVEARTKTLEGKHNEAKKNVFLDVKRIGGTGSSR